MGWGKLFLQNEFKRVSDPVNIEDPAVPFPKGKMTRMVNRLDPRVRFDLRAFELETGVVWQMSDYSPSELDYLDYQDLAFHGEAIVKAGSKGEFFTHFGLGDLEYVRGNGSGTGYAHTRLYGGYRGESSPKFAYEAAGGLLALDPAEGDYATDLYLTARATWEPAPGINRLMVNFRRDVRPSGIAAYAVADRAELSYAHWLKTRSHVETGASFESGRTPGGAGDWRTVGGFGGLRYEMGISRYFFVRYEHRARDSGVAGADFAADRVSSGLVYRF